MFMTVLTFFIDDLKKTVMFIKGPLHKELGLLFLALKH